MAGFTAPLLAVDGNLEDRQKVAGLQGKRKPMEQTGQCHCGSLRVITTGEPDRVYLCHCKACQRRTGTAFHFGATYPKERVRLDGERETRSLTNRTTRG